MQKRRFIAGASCPKCEKMDKIVMYDDENGERWRECVSCGFRDAISDLPEAEELATRVNQPRPGEQPPLHEDEVQVIRLVTQDKGKD